MSILQFDPNERPSILQIKANEWMEKMKKALLVQKIGTEKKKGKNIYGSLDLASTTKQQSNSKFGSMLFQDATNSHSKK